MKKINHKMLITLILFAGFFIGIFKGQEVRNQWVSKMKEKHDLRKMKGTKDLKEVTLDDFEIASFHKN